MRWVAGVSIMLGLVVFAAPLAAAEPALGLQPLEYVEMLQKAERKRAFIDITNPSSQPVMAQFTVQGFRQTDNNGTLAFYDDEKLNNGITLDYQEKEIPAKKTLRLFFVVDGTKLPTGDVFAAIFAQTKPVEAARVPSVRVGTLLILTNGTPGARGAIIEAFNMPFVHAGDSMDGQITIKNTAPASSASGFFPKITIQSWPFGPNTTITGPLVYAGNTRTVTLNQPSSQLGIYKITASYGDSSKYQWVLLITGIWKWILVAGLAIISVIIFAYNFLYKRRYRRR